MFAAFHNQSPLVTMVVYSDLLLDNALNKVSISSFSVLSKLTQVIAIHKMHPKKYNKHPFVHIHTAPAL